MDEWEAGLVLCPGPWNVLTEAPHQGSRQWRRACREDVHRGGGRLARRVPASADLPMSQDFWWMESGEGAKICDHSGWPGTSRFVNESAGKLTGAPSPPTMLFIISR